MRTILNIIWVVLAGFWLWLTYLAAGVLACLLIVTIPWGIASFRMANYALWPFGRTIVDKPGAGPASTIGNVVWILLFGWWLALGHLTTALAQAVTIIGIPLALANLKLIPVSLVPMGKDIVPVDAIGKPTPWGPGPARSISV
ncbi:MAG: YccF domain-containing protein [Actinomycetales bacterium]|nr:YccF domain-containing protein [Candidatus Phosphoribacter baldrii]